VHGSDPSTGAQNGLRHGTPDRREGVLKGPSRALARRYARALVDVAEARGKDVALALRSELVAFAGLLREHPDLARALEHPALAADARRRVLAAVCEQVGASDLLRRLADLVAARDRVALLPLVAETYGDMLNERRGVVSARATSAVALAAGQQQALAAALSRACGLEVELQARVEPEVLGGLVVRMGGKTYDGTVRTQLEALRRRLAAPDR
jgi:F-type H+-transporting ATPase subunit delta